MLNVENYVEFSYSIETLQINFNIFWMMAKTASPSTLQDQTLWVCDNMIFPVVPTKSLCFYKGHEVRLFGLNEFLKTFFALMRLLRMYFLCRIPPHLLKNSSRT